MSGQQVCSDHKMCSFVVKSDAKEGISCPDTGSLCTTLRSFGVKLQCVLFRRCCLQIFQTCRVPFYESKKQNEQHHSLWRMEQRFLIAIANLPLDHRFLASVNFRPVFADSDTQTEWVCSFCLSENVSGATCDLPAGDLFCQCRTSCSHSASRKVGFVALFPLLFVDLCFWHLIFQKFTELTL